MTRCLERPGPGAPATRTRRIAVRSGLVVLVLLTLVLAGCSSEGNQATLVTVEDNVDPAVAAAATTSAPPKPPKGSDVGHIAGYVVDEAYRIMVGVQVVLPAYGLNDSTDRKGEFAFVDLPPGRYLLEVNVTGYQPLRSLVEVKAEKFTRLQVVLSPIPPPDPFHVTYEFTGYSEVSTGMLGNTFYLDIEDAGLHTFIVEAFMDPHSDPASGNGFDYRLRGGGLDVYGEGPNPLYDVLPVDSVAGAGEYRLTVWPRSSPMPELAKEYEVFITAFFNGPPPEDWSIAGTPPQ